MNYEFEFERKASKFIAKQPPAQQKRILSAISELPDRGDRKRLAGTDGVYRLRVGTYRILYTVDNGKLIVRVIDAKNRGDAYTRL